MATLDTVAPYFEQLLEDDDVRNNLERARTRARQAYGATKRKGAKKAAGGARVRARVTGVAARDAVFAAKRGRERELRRQQRRTRLRRGLVLLVLARGAAAADRSSKRRSRHG